MSKRLYIYALAVEIASACREEGANNYPDNWTYEELTPDGCITVEYNTKENFPRVCVFHADPDNRRPCPNIEAAILQELPDIGEIAEEYYERGEDYYTAGYPEVTMTNADFL